jgi:hypothetical protein
LTPALANKSTSNFSSTGLKEVSFRQQTSTQINADLIARRSIFLLIPNTSLKIISNERRDSTPAITEVAQFYIAQNKLNGTACTLGTIDTTEASTLGGGTNDEPRTT